MTALYRLACYLKKIRSPAVGDIGGHRWRKIFISFGSTLASRGLAQGCNLLSVPIALRYLGAERFGVWVTLTSAVGLLSFFDFGIGIGLQNRVAEMLGKGQLDRLGQCMRSTLIVLLTISCFFFAIVAICISKTSLVSTIFSGAPFETVNLSEALTIIAGAFLLGLPLSLFSRIAFGLQLGWIASVASTCGNVLSLLAVFIATLLQADFTAFVALTVVPPIAAQIIGYILLTHKMPKRLRLLGTTFFSEGLRTLHQGTPYILPQITGVILTQGPMFVLGTQSSPLNAACFSILSRISAPLQQIQQLFLAQIWPAITEAMHRGDIGWLRTTLRRTVRGNLFFGVLTGVLVALLIFGVFPLLANDVTIKPSFFLMVLYATHVGTMCVAQGLGMIANSLTLMRLPNYLAGISIVLAFSALPFAARRYGTEGVLVAMLSLNSLLTIPFLYREYIVYQRQTARF